MAGRTTGTSRVPIVGWLRTYDRSGLRGDLIAGVTDLALVVPKNLGYAGIAGIPVQNGLYAAAAGAILYAVSARAGRSRSGRARAWPPSPRAPSSPPASSTRRPSRPSSPG